jgi:hypothetical protein
MQSPDEIKLFGKLVENGFRFIERSVAELRTEPNLSVAHFATGLELLLKARLFAVHWSLIAQRPHDCRWASLLRGEVVTIQASDLCKTITTVTGAPLGDQQTVFNEVFKHRNRVLHWLPSVNVESVAAEQCRAWFALHQLLTGPWKELYAGHEHAIRSVDRALFTHRPYLQARFDALKSTLKGLAIQPCPSCTFPAAVLKEASLRVTSFLCRVCETDGHLAQFSCGHWLSLYHLPLPCPCGQKHTNIELAAQLDPQRPLDQKDALYEPDPPGCGECLEDAPVVNYRGRWLCLACGTRFSLEELSSCANCGTRWVGYDTEDSAAMGCSHCSFEE